jgi:hypothetical protein
MENSSAPFTTSNAEQTCFLYDKATGDVVHIHQFCPVESGDRCSDAAMERAARDNASTDHAKLELAAFHHSGELMLESGHRYRIDPKQKTFIAEPMAEWPRGRPRSSELD